MALGYATWGVIPGRRVENSGHARKVARVAGASGGLAVAGRSDIGGTGGPTGSGVAITVGVRGAGAPTSARA